MSEPKTIDDRATLASQIAARFLIAKDHSHIISHYPKAVENALLLIDEVEKQLAAKKP
ncbi:MAG: hypothetical protein WCT04_07205 [Planctomycetota bacterium]